MWKYFPGQTVSDIRNIITSSESFKTSSASNNSSIEAEKSIVRRGTDPEYQKLKNTVTDHYTCHFIRNKTDVDWPGIEPCRQRSVEPAINARTMAEPFENEVNLSNIYRFNSCPPPSQRTTLQLC